jgi:hypothetical protein
VRNAKTTGKQQDKKRGASIGAQRTDQHKNTQPRPPCRHPIIAVLCVYLSTTKDTYYVALSISRPSKSIYHFTPNIHGHLTNSDTQENTHLFGSSLF